MISNTFSWPDGKKCAALISVNLDAEFYGRIFYPGVDVDTGDINRLGKSGMEFGLPRLLSVLDEYDVKATFFIPGEVALRYPDEVKQIAQRGHEIGCHGLEHELLAHLPNGTQEEVIRTAKEILMEKTGCEVNGFRMPEGEMTEDTLKIVKELGFKYSSSLSDDDVPYYREASGILELPIHWQLFDLPYFTFAFRPPIPPGSARSAEMNDVLKNWMYELEGARCWGTLFNLQLDPQTIGEQGRIFMLERLLEKIKSSEDIWLATGEEIADYCEKTIT